MKPVQLSIFRRVGDPHCRTFGQPTLELLRQTVEDGIVTISRAQGSITFPAKFMLVAAMNPCPWSSVSWASCSRLHLIGQEGLVMAIRGRHHLLAHQPPS